LGGPDSAEPERRARLWDNSKRLHDGFRALGLDLGCVAPACGMLGD
jgi:hypothetical protein